MDLKLPKKRVIQNNAPPWKRVVSFIIDLLIIQFIIFGPFSGVIQNKLPITSDFMQNYALLESNPNFLNELMPMFLILFLLVYAYFVIFEFKMKQTPGKIILNLKLVANKKEKITLIKIILRNFAAFPIFPFSLLWIIDPLYLVITGSRLSDKISKTSYVEEITL